MTPKHLHIIITIENNKTKQKCNHRINKICSIKKAWGLYTLKNLLKQSEQISLYFFQISKIKIW